MPRTLSLPLLLLTAVVCMCMLIDSASAVTFGETNDFQDGTDQGWTNDRAQRLITIQTGGMDGDDDRFLFVESDERQGPGSRMAVFNSLGAWTGDYQGATSVELDMMNPSDSKELEMRLVLFGPNSDSNRWTSDVGLVVPNDGAWHHYSFPISDGEIVRVQGSATYEDMLSDVVRAMFRHDLRTPSSRGDPIAATLGIDNIRLNGPPSVLGDFDNNGVVDVLDVNLLSWEVAAKTNDATFDLNADQAVDDLDLNIWVKELKKTWFGDADLNGLFDSSDFVSVFQSGKFEMDLEARWDEGDWNGDHRFDSSDFVTAFQDGGFENGPLPAVDAVPEPSTLSLIVMGLMFVARRKR